MKKNLLIFILISLFINCRSDSKSNIKTNENVAQLLHLTEYQVINPHSNYHLDLDKSLIIDEYDALEYDPINNDFSLKYHPKTTFMQGYGLGAWYYPWPIIFDFEKKFNIKNIVFHRGSKSTNIHVYYSNNGIDWTFLYTESMGSTFNSLRQKQVDVTCQYIKFEAEDYWSPTLAAVAGSPLDGSVDFGVPPIKPLTAPMPTMEKLIGICSFNDVPADVEDCAESIREYLDVTWFTTHNPKGVTYPDVTYRFAPVNAGFNFDEYYRSRKEAGKSVIPVMKNCPRHLDIYINSEGSHNRGEYKPLDNGATNPKDPQSYKAYSELLFQHAARYGSVKIDQSLLKTDPADEPLTGLNLLEWYEIWNEPDTWWRDEEGYFDPEMLAAMISAAVDGHKGALGTGHGLRNADPNRKVSMGGTAKVRPDYYRMMFHWWDVNRGKGDYPIDAVAFHHYSNDAGGQGNSKKGVSPEEDDIFNKMIKIKEWFQRYQPDMYIFNGEYGWDTQVSGGQTSPAINANNKLTDTYTVQSQWLIRGYLLHAAAGIHRVDQYMIRDVNTSPGETYHKYGNSGLTTSKSSGYGKKPSWYFVNTLSKRLKGYKFHSIISNGRNTGIWNLKFTNGEKVAYAIWYGTTSNNESDELINLSGSYKNCTLIEFNDKQATGKSTLLQINNNNVKVKITETPILLLCSQEALTVPKAPDLSLKNVGEHSISLNILDNVDNEEFFILERSLNESNGFEEVVILNGGTTSYLDHGLNDDTFYYYRIKSRNKSGDSPYSKTIKIRTKKDGLTLEKTIVINVRRFIDGTVPKNREYVDFTVPGDKIGFGKSFQSETLTKLNGEKVEIGLALSNFNYGNTNGGGSLDNSIHPDDVCKTNLITNKNVVGVIKFLNLNDDKYYSIHLFSRRGWNSSKIPVRFINKELDITLNAGNNLENEAEIYTLKPDQDGTITITIQNGAEGDLGYLNAIRVEVFSENDDAIKDDNNTGSLVPASPTELKLQSLRPDSVMLSWKDKSDNESHFEIQISKDETFSSEILNFETGINDSTILINGLEEYSIYYARARAKNHHGYSNLSNTIFFKTLLLTKKLNLKIYPNPADNHVNIEYNIMADDQVEIQLIDLITGQQIKTLLNAFQVKNKYKIKWELGDININRIKNLFLIKIITSQVSEYKKLMIIKNKFNF